MRRLICFAILAFSLAAVGQAPSSAPAEPVAKTTITQEQLEARLKELQKAHDQIIAQLSAVEGAMQECQHWLLELKTPPPAAKPAPVLPNK